MIRVNEVYLRWSDPDQNQHSPSKPKWLSWTLLWLHTDLDLREQEGSGSDSDFRERRVKQQTTAEEMWGMESVFSCRAPRASEEEEEVVQGWRINPGLLHIPSWCWCFVEVQQTAGLTLLIIMSRLQLLLVAQQCRSTCLQIYTQPHQNNSTKPAHLQSEPEVQFWVSVLISVSQVGK